MKTTVADFMTRNPITIDAGATIMEAIHLMQERDVRRLPVMRNGRLAGIVTDRMLKEYAPGKATPLDTWQVHYLLSKTPVTEVMNATPHTVTPDRDLLDAATIIRDHKLYGLCVVDERGDLVGILTIKDLIDALFYTTEAARGVAV
ncbi:MAG TPA: CBS domain-containing protein [Thermoanaerobaculia bacterium]